MTIFDDVTSGVDKMWTPLSGPSFWTPFLASFWTHGNNTWLYMAVTSQYMAIHGNKW